MKVTRIFLKQYLNFKDGLTIDLTYPIDHPDPKKRGQPLDRVCIIGQSGSGKTSLLNLIKYFSFEKDEINNEGIDQELIKDNVELHFNIGNKNFSKKLFNEGKFEYYVDAKIQNVDFEKSLVSSLVKSKPWLIHFPYNIIEESSRKMYQLGKILPSDAQSEVKFVAEQGEIEVRKKQLQHQNIWDFSIHEINALWEIVFDEILLYKNQWKEERKKFTERAFDDPGNAQTYKDTFNKWLNENDDPIKKLAKSCLNDILKLCNLEVNTDLNLENDSDWRFINLKQINNKMLVPYAFLSTGTKQLMLTAIPLFYLEAKDAIILFDQPESSLYPDIQLRLVEEYGSLTKNCQFFYATHSPIVASAFEPWEIIELIFNSDTGKVEVFPRYQGENKISNYTIYPQYLSFGNIYMDVFDMAEDGNPKYRNPQMTKLVELKSQLVKLKKDKTQNGELKIKIDEIETLANKLGVDLRSFLLVE